MGKKPVRSKENFLVFGAPHIEAEAIDEVVATLRSGWIGTGRKVAQFEHDFALYKNAKNAVALHSCTAALHLSLLAANLRPYSEVITTPLTFCATVNAIQHAGLVPVLADINPDTLNIDPKKIEAAITKNTSAILPVHFAGRPCEMDQIMEIAHNNNLIVIEDCAHSIESIFHTKHIGTFGDFGCFSFYATKNITTGEGGMVLTNNDENASRIKRLALHGMSADAWNRYGDDGYKHYHVVECGFKYNMMDLQASIGLHQLQKIDAYHKRRIEIGERYNSAFSNFPLLLPAKPEPDTVNAHHLYQILIDEKVAGISRDRFLQEMTFNGIGVGVHYLSLPEHPYYQKTFGWNPDCYPVAKKVGRQTVSIPLSPYLTNHDVDDVIEAVYNSLGR